MARRTLATLTLLIFALAPAAAQNPTLLASSAYFGTWLLEPICATTDFFESGHELKGYMCLDNDNGLFVRRASQFALAASNQLCLDVLHPPERPAALGDRIGLRACGDPSAQKWSLVAANKPDRFTMRTETDLCATVRLDLDKFTAFFDLAKCDEVAASISAQFQLIPPSELTKQSLGTTGWPARMLPSK